MESFPNIELRQLRYFLAAAELGSFRKAGVSLNIRESSISRRIRDLEDELGASLFHRHSGGVRLTEAGMRFQARAREILHQVGDGVREVGAVGCVDLGRVRIGIFSSLASGFLTDLLCSFAVQHVGVQVDIADGLTADHVAAVRRLELDVAFVAGTREWSGCEVAHLWSERVFVALPKDHALARLPEIEWGQIAAEPLIVSDTGAGRAVQSYLIRRLSELGYQPEITSQGVARDNLLSLVAIGRGLTVMSEAATAAQFPGVTYRPIAGETLPFSAVWSPDNDNPAFRRLLSMAKQMSRERGGPGAVGNPPDQRPG